MQKFDYVKLLPENFEDIRSDIELKASGFNSKGNFDFILNTVDNFPELAGVEPNDRREKIRWMATYYLFHLTKGHCFNDGNKRTAFIATAAFLAKNGFVFDFDAGKAKPKIEILEHALESGERLAVAFEHAFGDDISSGEYRLTSIIFGLSGAPEFRNFYSPIELYPVLVKLIQQPNNAVKKGRS